MTVETMDDRKISATDQRSVTVIQATGSGEGGKKSRVTRKHVIIGVTCALVVAMVITGVLLGVKFYLDSSNELVMRTLEFKIGENEKVKEDVGADVKQNYVQYHRQDDDSEVTVIEDFNRELRVLKVRQAGGSKCYITVLNTSDSALPQAVLNATATDDTVETDDLYYEISETAIKDHSMLGAHGQKLCTNMDVYWMTQTCSPDEDETPSTGDSNRQKRGRFRDRIKRIWKKIVCWVKKVTCWLKWTCREDKCFWRKVCSWARERCQ